MAAQGQAHRIERAQDLLELAKVRPLVFAMAIVQEVRLIRLVEDRHRGRSNPGRVRRQRIDPDQVLAQLLFQRLTHRSAAYGVQQILHTFVAEVGVPNGTAEGLCQGALVSGDPVAHRG